MAETTSRADAPPPDVVRRQLVDICLNSSLDRARGLRKLLHYLVDAKLAGIPQTETSVAVGCLGRDPQTHSTAAVRVAIREIRKRLREYYLSDHGKQAVVDISIPPGYNAAFQYTQQHRRAAPATGPLESLIPPGAFETTIRDDGTFQLPDPFLESLKAQHRNWLEAATVRDPSHFPKSISEWFDKKAGFLPIRLSPCWRQEFVADVGLIEKGADLPTIAIPAEVLKYSGLDRDPKVFIWEERPYGVISYFMLAQRCFFLKEF